MRESPDVVVSLTMEYVASTNRIHCKKGLAVFPSPAGMSLPNSPSPGIILIIPGQGEFGESDIQDGDGKTATFFTVYTHVLTFAYVSDNL